jgi:hypothetical protein
MKRQTFVAAAVVTCIGLAAGLATDPRGAGPGHGDPARLTRLRAARMPVIDHPVSFDTPAADAVLAALEVFPPDNPWNLVVGD